MIVLPKLTVKDMKCDPKRVLGMEGDEARQMMCRIYGVASDTKVKTLTDTRDGSVKNYEQLKGQFRGINLTTGERFQSGILYLPEGIHELLAEPLKAAHAANEDAEVTFGFDVFSEKRKNVAGYGYGAVVLGEPAADDAFARLESDFVKAGAPALPAPAEPKPETAKK